MCSGRESAGIGWVVICPFVGTFVFVFSVVEKKGYFGAARLVYSGRLLLFVVGKGTVSQTPNLHLLARAKPLTTTAVLLRRKQGTW